MKEIFITYTRMLTFINAKYSLEYQQYPIGIVVNFNTTVILQYYDLLQYFSKSEVTAQ